MRLMEILEPSALLTIIIQAAVRKNIRASIFGGGGSPIRHNWRVLLTKCISITKHGRHVGDARCVPLRDVGVERTGINEHPPHVSDARCVPLRDVGVERTGTIEHVVHRGDARCVPL